MLTHHITYTDHNLKISLAALGGETSQEQTFPTSSMNLFYW